MKKILGHSAVALGVGALLVAGCSSTPDPRGPVPTTHYSQEALEDHDEVVLPDNYSVDNFRKLQLLVNVKIVDIPEGADPAKHPGKIDSNLSSRMQTEMAKLKRFEVFSLHNRAKVEMDALGDIDDEVKLVEATDIKASDLMLTGSIRMTTSRQEMENDIVYVYTAEGDISCEDVKTRKVYFAEKARGVWSRRVRYSITGQSYGNVSEDQAKYIACLRCLSLIANKLGNAFPVGGRVTNLTGSGETMVMAAGQHEGIGPNQQVCVFLSEDGLDIPIAYARATPKNDGTSQLRVYRWNTDNDDASAIVDEIRGSARAFIKNYKGDKKNGLYAVAFGMATPADWDKDPDRQ